MHRTQGCIDTNLLLNYFYHIVAAVAITWYMESWLNASTNNVICQYKQYITGKISHNAIIVAAVQCNISWGELLRNCNAVNIGARFMTHRKIV